VWRLLRGRVVRVVLVTETGSCEGACSCDGSCERRSCSGSWGSRGTKRVEEGYTEGTGYGKVQRKYSGDQVKE
jgi:hypothetical protein